MNINYKRGIFRLWVVGFMCWIAFVAIETGPVEQRTLRYYTDNANLTADERTQGCADFEYAVQRRLMALAVLSNLEAQCARLSRLLEMADIPVASEKNAQVTERLVSSINECQGLMDESFPVAKCVEQVGRVVGLCGANYSGVIQATKASLVDERKREANCLATYTAKSPDWSWLALMILPPTLGVGLFLAAGWLLYSLLCWLKNGFTQSDATGPSVATKLAIDSTLSTESSIEHEPERAEEYIPNVGMASTFSSAVIYCYRNSGNYHGRASRKEYWFFQLYFVLLVLVDQLSFHIHYSNVSSGLIGLMILSSIPPGIAVAVRRLHDTNRSGWWVFITLVPIVGGISWLVFMLQPSDRHTNDYD